MPLIHFAKYQSLENDFCVVGHGNSDLRWSPRRVVEFCHRRRGIGADGLIVLGPPGPKGARFRLFNADGTHAEWSGNGVRCAAASLLGTKTRADIRLLTAAGAITVAVKADAPGRFRATFERPLPIVGSVVARARRLAPSRTVGPIPVDAGNPHWIFIVPDFDIPWAEVGLAAQELTSGTHGINVEFVSVLDRRRIQMRIFERGVGPTPSSGSGALAAVAACLERGLVDPLIRVISPGGQQTAEIDRDRKAVRLMAMTHYVFSGVWKAV
jgi:diaminopimelate epimerase